jgi:protein phosphatase 1 regulatory subunit 42
MADTRPPLAPRNDGGDERPSEASRVKFTPAEELSSRSIHGSYFHPNSSSFSLISGSSKMPSHMLAEDLIMKGAKRRPTLGQSISDFYASITHLHFQNLRIVGDVEPIRLCANLRVLYLYENRLTSLKGIGQLRKLTNLYAQDNRIADLSDFEAPPALTQLYLGGNRLSLIEGLEGCEALEELHLEGQRQPEREVAEAGLIARIATVRIAEEEVADGAKGMDLADGSDAATAQAPATGADLFTGGATMPALSIAPASLMAIAPTLRKLVMHHNGLDDEALEPIVVLQALTSLDARHNRLSSVARLQQLLVRMPQLVSVQLHGNDELTSAPKFRERVIVATHVVAELDGKPIKESERAFLLQLAQRQAIGPPAGPARAAAGPPTVRAASAAPGPPTVRAEARQQRLRQHSAILATQRPQQLGVSIPSAQSYVLGSGHGLVGGVPAGFGEQEERGNSAGLPSGTRRPWARTPHAV